MRVSRWRRWLFAIAFPAWSIGFPFLCLPLLLLRPSKVPLLYRPWAAGARWVLKHVAGITYQVKGSEHIPSRGAIIACKHQSAMDIVLLTSCVEYPSYVLKRELLWIPVWGWFLNALGNIPINRKKARASMDAVVQGSKHFLHQGRPVIVFPEGTRVPAGERRKLLPGIAVMADALKVPVVPAAVNTGLFWPKKGGVQRSGVCTVEFMPPIPAGTPPRELLKRLQLAIDEKTSALEQECRVVV